MNSSVLLAAMIRAQLDGDNDAVRRIAAIAKRPGLAKSIFKNKSLPSRKKDQGFTGKTQDSLGRTHCYQNGTHVPCNQQGNDSSQQNNQQQQQQASTAPPQSESEETQTEVKVGNRSFRATEVKGELKVQKKAASDWAVEHYGEYCKGLSEEEKQALSDYQNTDFIYSANSKLRGLGKGGALGLLAKMRMGDQDKRRIRAMDEAIENAPDIPSGTILHRAMVIQGAMTNPAAVENLKGKIIEDNAFISTTTVADPKTMSAFMLKGDRVKAEIVVGEGCKGISLEKEATGINTKFDENEMLLARGTKFKVNDVVQDDDGRWRIKLEMMPYRPEQKKRLDLFDGKTLKQNEPEEKNKREDRFVWKLSELNIEDSANLKGDEMTKSFFMKSLSQLRGKSLNPPRVKEGFTGKQEDALGRMQCYQEGQHVACQGGEKPGSKPDDKEKLPLSRESIGKQVELNDGTKGKIVDVLDEGVFVVEDASGNQFDVDPSEIKQAPKKQSQPQASKDKPDNKNVAQATFDRAVKDYANLKQRYLKEVGAGTYDSEGNLTSIMLNTDDWRKLFPEYKGTNAQDVHEASSYLNKRAFADALKEMKGKGNGKMIVLAGGGGSGKGTATGSFYDQSQYPIRLDQVSDNVEKLIAKVDEAKKAGFEPEYVFIDRDPSDAWIGGVVKRAMSSRKKGELARTVPLQIALAANLDARKTALDLIKKRPDIPVAIVNNNLGPGKQRLITSAEEAIPYLEGEIKKYDGGKLYKKLVAETAAMYKAGEIPEDIAKGLLDTEFDKIKKKD